MTFLPPRSIANLIYPGRILGGTRKSAVRARQFDGFPVVLDSSGQARHGLCVNMEPGDIQAVTPGSQGLSFGGVDEWVDCGVLGALNFEFNQPFSVACWFNTTNGGGPNYLLAHATSGGFIRGYFLHLSGGAPAGTLANDYVAGNRISRFSSVLYNDGNWHHALFTYDGSGVVAGLRVFVDAVEPASVTTNALAGTIQNATRTCIGARDGLGPFVWKGSDAAIWDKQLSPAEVQDVFHQGLPTNLRALSSAPNLKAWWRMGERFSLGANGVPDFSGSGYHGTQQNMEITDVVSRTSYGTSIAYGGVDEYSRFGDVLGFEYNQPWSIAFWVSTTGAANVGVVTKIDASVDTRGYGIYLDAGGQVRIYLINSTGGTYVSLRSTNVVNTGAWKRVLVTYSGSGTAAGVIVYLDAVVDAKVVTTDALAGNTILNAGESNISGRSNGTAVLTGAVDEVTVWNRVLTPTEVAEEYNNAVPINPRNLSSASALLAWWRFGSMVP